MKRRLHPIALAAFVVAGCTTYSIDRGQEMIASGQVDEGLAELERIARENPGNAKARGAYMTQRLALIAQLVSDADTARLWGQFDDAERLYQRVLRIDPANPTALKGLDSVAKDREHTRLVAEGEMLLKAGDLAGAEAKARSVLAENSGQRGARAVMRAVADRRAAAQMPPVQLSAALQRPVTLEFRDANLRSVFEVIARTSGINFVFDRDVRADLRTTIFVRDTNLDDVIKLLLITNQLDRKVMNENSILIFPNTPAKQKDYQELVVRAFYLANADAKQTAQLVRSVAKSRDVYIDEKLNLLVVKDTPQAIRLIEQLVATQDLGEPEVLLEVEVLEVARSVVNELGLNPADSLSYGVGLGGTTSGGTPPSALVPLTGGGFRWFVPNPAAVLRLRGTEGTANVLANPRIRVKNREKARVHIGEKVPVITTTSTANVGVSSSVSYLDTGLKLDVEPNVYLEDEVAIKVQLEVSNILEQLNVNNTIAYRLGTRNTTTTLRLKDGETSLLAGLISDDDRRAVEGLPYAAQIPILNRLFANTESRAKTEIVLMITPRVVRNVLRPDTVPAQFPSGTDSNVGAAPLLLRPTKAGSLSVSGSGTAVASTAPVPQLPGPRVAADGASLLLAAPSQVGVGQEFSMSFGLPSNSNMRSARIELVYDPKVFQAVGAPNPEANRVVLDIAGPEAAGARPAPREIRFRVIASAPTTSTITLERVEAVDAGGVPVPIAAPPAHSINVTQGQGPR